MTFIVNCQKQIDYIVKIILILFITQNTTMSSPAINIVIKMMESLSEDKQNKIIEHLREYIQDLQDEEKWNECFNKSQDKLIAAAKLARQQIAEGKAQPMDYDKL